MQILPQQRFPILRYLRFITVPLLLLLVGLLLNKSPFSFWRWRVFCCCSCTFDLKLVSHKFVYHIPYNYLLLYRYVQNCSCSNTWYKKIGEASCYFHWILTGVYSTKLHLYSSLALQPVTTSTTTSRTSFLSLVRRLLDFVVLSSFLKFDKKPRTN